MRSMTKTVRRLMIVALFAMGVGNTSNARGEEHRYFEMGETGVRGRFLLGVGLTLGGDKLFEGEKVWFRKDTGEEVRRTDVDTKAGEAAHLHTGLIFWNPDYPLEIKTTLGFHAAGTSADNMDVRFYRIPFDVLVFYKHVGWRFGAGLTAHFNPTFSVDIDGHDKEELDMDTALGPVASVEYQWTHWRLGARYVHMEYEADDLEDESIDGSHFGIYGAWTP